MFVFRIPSRKPITSVTNEELGEILAPYYGSEKNNGYFIGAGFGPGWNDIVLDLHNKLVKEKPDYYIVQIKEKFSTLRYYTGPMTDQGHMYIAVAENLSAETCEECGRPGKLDDTSYWIVTSCDWDRRIGKINRKLWNLQSYPRRTYFKIKLAIDRRRMKKA